MKYLYVISAVASLIGALTAPTNGEALWAFACFIAWICAFLSETDRY